MSNESTSFSINANAAFEALEKLQREASELNQKFKQMKRGTEEYVDTAKRLKEVSAGIKDNADKLGLAGLSANQLAYQYRTLKKEITGLVPGTSEFIEKSIKLTEIKDRMTLVNREMSEYGKVSAKGTQATGFFQNALGGAKMGAALLVTALLAVGKVIFDVFSKGIYLAAKYSDQFADIRKTTGMTAKEVENLAKSLEALDTRTSLSDLLDIAKIGGQIGVAKEQMEGFVKSVDMAVVALGDEFSGGAEEVAKQMGTLQNLFKETKELNAGEAISRIGSAVNQLGSEGMATGPVMAEFTARMGQLGSLGPNLTDTLGLASVLTGDLGLSAEIAAGGLTNVLMTMSKDTQAFASFMGMTKEAFEKTFNEDSNKILLQFAERFKGMSDTEIIATLDALGIKSQEANKVFGGLSQNIDKVTKSQMSANNAFKENTSLQNEFALKNETRAAKQEKATKLWQKFVTEQGQKVAPFFAKMLDLLPVGIRILESFSTAFGRIFAQIGTGFASVGRLVETISKLFGKTGAQIDFIDLAVRSLVFTMEATVGLLMTVIQPIVAIFEVTAEFIRGFVEGWEKGFVHALTTGASYAFKSFEKNAQDWGGNFLGLVDTMTFGIFKLEEQFDRLTGRVSGATQQMKGSILELMGLNDSLGKSGSLQGGTKGADGAIINKGIDNTSNKETKTQADNLKKQIDAERLLQQERIKLIKDDFERRMAELDFQFAEELKKFEGNEAQKMEFAKIKETQKQEAIAQLRKEFADKEIEEEIALRKKLDARKKEAFDKEISNLQAEHEAKLFQKEMQEIAEQEYLEQLKDENHALYLEKELERQATEHEMQMQFFDARLELLKQYGYLETEEGKKLLLEKERAEQEYAARTLANEQRTALQKKKIKKEEVGYFASAAKELVGLLAEDEKARSEYSAVLKALALAEIGINLNREIQAIWASEMATKGTVLGTIGAAVFTGLAVARAGVASANVMSYRDGGIFAGPSHAQGGISAIDSRTGKKVAEFEGNEPFLILSSNTYQNNKEVVDSLLYSSMHRNGAAIFADGGVVGTASAGVSLPNVVNNNSQEMRMLMAKIEMLILQVATLTTQISQNADAFKRVYVLFEDIEKSITQVQQIQRDNRL